MKTRDVKVTATLGAAGIEWDIDGAKPNASCTDFKRKSGSHKVEFKFDDKTEGGLRFDCSSPIWVNENTSGSCPPPGVHTDQIEVISCDPDELTILNKNEGVARTLHYQLNFVDGAGHRIHVDPEFKNGGSK
jgi:hypothetical protein